MRVTRAGWFAQPAGHLTCLRQAPGRNSLYSAASIRYGPALAEPRVPVRCAMLRFACTTVIVSWSVLSSGCSVMMAARSPEKKDLSVLSLGVPRSQVIAELGTPVHQSNDEFGERDVFSFRQGYSVPVRVGRATVHAVGDLLTLGLWEVVSTPLESSLNGEGVQAEVRYDRQQYVRRVEFFSGAHLAHGGPTLAPWMRGASTQQTGILESASPDPEAAYYEEVVSEVPDDS